MKQNYTKLDAAILACIQKFGPISFTSLQGDEVGREAAYLAKNQIRPIRYERKPAWRFVDARLQALRKAGKIRYFRDGWVLCEKGGAA